MLADIPGLIEGAAAGPGLGHEFLAHVERCSMLVHLVELTPLEGDPVGNYEMVRAELEAYGAGLERLPELVVLSKRDLLEASAVEAAVAEWTERLGDSVLGVMAASSATGEGLEDLRRRILAELATVQPLELAAPGGVSGGRVRVRAPRLPPGRRGRLLGRAARTTAPSASAAAASSSSSNATTPKTKKPSPTSSSASPRSA